MKTDTTTLISALKILARDIESGDGVENACIAEGADRLEELNRDAKRYCFLRERDLNTIQIGGDFAGQVPENYVLNLDDLDAAVDEATTKVGRKRGRMTRKPKSPAQLQKEVESFNRRFPVGSEVTLKKDGIAEPVRTRISSVAFVMASHSAVVFLDGVSGCYLTSHVSEAA